MNKLKIYGVMLLVVIGLAGCDAENRSRSGFAGSTYTGVIPCADCEGIAYRLSLKEDHRFESSSVYIGKSKSPYIERGSWRVKGDSMLVLNESEEHAQQFKITNDQLIMLDPQGSPVSGSLSKMFVLGHSGSTSTDTTWKKQRALGIDFRALGRRSGWTLNIDFDKRMIFKMQNKDSVRLSVPVMRKDTISHARIWSVVTPGRSLKMEIYPIGCVDDTSGEVFTHFVHVVYNGQSYRGCGNFINPQYALNDFWEMESIDGIKVTTFKAVLKNPVLQFDVAHHQVYGNTGCNQLHGNIALKDSSLSFSTLITTKMACRGGRLESKMLAALNRTNRYEIVQARLLLKEGTDTLMVFRRSGANE